MELSSPVSPVFCASPGNMSYEGWLEDDYDIQTYSWQPLSYSALYPLVFHIKPKQLSISNTS